VLDVYGIEPAQPEAADLTEAGRLTLDRVRDGATGADELVRATGLDAGALATALTELELAGLVVQREGVYRAE
jgi:predicted Rossmann fold nucleotide-binding protein DprA/Smf involved in DNA uptake